MIVMKFDACANETRAEVILRDMLSLFGIGLEAERIHGLLQQWNAITTNSGVSFEKTYILYIKIKLKEISLNDGQNSADSRWVRPAGGGTFGTTVIKFRWLTDRTFGGQLNRPKLRLKYVGAGTV